MGANFLKGETVEDVFSGEPSLASPFDAKGEVVESIDTVGIWIDRGAHTLVLSALPPSPVHIGTLRSTVELDDRACLGSTVDDLLCIDRVGVTSEQDAARHVTEHSDVLILHSLDHTLGHRILVHIERLVHGGDTEVELG